METEDTANRSENLLRIVRTFNMYLSFFGLGLCYAVCGPTLLDLQMNVGTDMQQITYIYASRSVGGVAGSILGGIIFDRFNRQALFSSLIFFSALLNFTIPWWRNIYGLALSMLLSGISLGAIDTGANVWCLDLWQSKSGPFMQALHFTYGLGAFVAPLIAEPFLSPSISNNITLNFNETTLTPLETMSPDGYYTINSYSIISGFVFLVSIAFTVTMIIKPKDVPRHTLNVERQNETTAFYKAALLSSAVLFVTLFCGVEISYGQMITTFAVKCDLKLTKSIGSFMTSLYWGTYTAGRAIGVVMAAKMSSFSMLVVDLLVINFACVLLACFANTNETLLWVGTAILGTGMASLYGAHFTWIERYVRVSSKVASLFVVSGSMGEMIFPILIGHFMDVRPTVLLYMNLAGCITCFLVFAFMYRVSTLITDKYDRDSKAKKELSAKDAVEIVPLNGSLKSNEETVA